MRVVQEQHSIVPKHRKLITTLLKVLFALNEIEKLKIAKIGLKQVHQEAQIEQDVESLQNFKQSQNAINNCNMLFITDIYI